MPDVLRVLLAEDDEDDFIIVSGFLKEIRDPRFDIDWAPTYEAAEEQVCQNQHDLYLFDYRLGAKNGLDLLKVAQQHGCVVPIIMLTGHGLDGTDVHAVRAAAPDYLVNGRIAAQLMAAAIRY